jgi:hypothetical protein
MPGIRISLNACTDSECNLHAATHAASEQISRAATLRTNMIRSQNLSDMSLCVWLLRILGERKRRNKMSRIILTKEKCGRLSFL